MDTRHLRDGVIMKEMEVTMKKLTLGAMFFVLALPLSAATWKDVSLMDAGCSVQKEKMDAPDAHTKHCAMKCGIKGGYGAIIDGKFVKFDKKGDELTHAALGKLDKEDHLRADITGEIKDGKLEVSTIDVK
jgi:hypothetical protein